MAAVIVSIKDHPEYVDIVSEWCYNEWLEENADCGIFSEAQYKEDIIKNYLRTDTAWPVLLVAVLLSGEPCGTVALDGRDMSQRPDLSPWLASLFVPPQFRRRGIGLQLVRGLQDVRFRQIRAIAILWKYGGDYGMDCYNTSKKLLLNFFFRSNV